MKALSFILNTHLQIAISGALLSHGFMVTFFDQYAWPLPLFLFGITGFIYSLNGLSDKEEDKVNSPQKSDFNNKYGKVITLIYLLLTGVSVFNMELNLPILIAVLALFLVGFFYSYPLFPWIKNGSLKFYRFKEVFFFKNFITTISQVLFLLYLPFLYFGTLPKAEIWILGFNFFAIMFVATTLCDLRDIEGDQDAGIKTIPTIIGSGKTFNLCFLLLVIPLSLTIIMKSFHLVPNSVLAIIMVMNFTQLIFLFSQKRISAQRNLFSFGVDFFTFSGAFYMILF